MRLLINDPMPQAPLQWTSLLSKAFPQLELVSLKADEPLLEKVIYHDWDIFAFYPDAFGREGFDLLREIRKRKPLLPILVISDLTPELIALRAIKSGASAFLTRDDLAVDLVPAFQHLLNGKKYINNRTAELIAVSLEYDQHGLPHESLSDRELNVFQLIVSGKTIAEIGEQLHLSNNTINTYRSRILDKLNLSNNQELEQYAKLYKLTDKGFS
ncbi:MAG: DNA-binding response regulator [Sphingobacteriia bacterium]|nr:MAG: DNA-binding response regulator [Sphingobacteriia bacterium]